MARIHTFTFAIICYRRSACFSAKIYSFVLTAHQTVIDWAAYVQNILQPSFVGPLDVIDPRHLPTFAYNACAIIRLWLYRKGWDSDSVPYLAACFQSCLSLLVE